MHCNSETSSADDGLFDCRFVTRDVRMVRDEWTCATYKVNGGSLDVCNAGSVKVIGDHTHPADLDDTAECNSTECVTVMTCDHDVDPATP